MTDVLASGEESLSAAFEEIDARDSAEQVYQPEILGRPELFYKKPGYSM